MSLVQPTRAPNATGNNVGVKRPYQLMINSAAHNSTDGSYPGRLKNMKLDRDALLDELSEDNLVSYLHVVKKKTTEKINKRKISIIASQVKVYLEAKFHPNPVRLLRCEWYRKTELLSHL